MVNTSQYPRLKTRPEASFFLLGPRGVGKSTWTRERLPDAHTVNLLDEGLYQQLLADPGLFAGRLRPLLPEQWVVVDEVQRIPSLLNEVHRFIEQGGLRFALLGSSARKLKSSGTNLLAGRAQWNAMFPLVPEELGGSFDLERTLRWGSIALVWQAADPRATLESYAQLYLREEVKAEALVRNLAGFVRFLPVAGLFHGQTVNVSALARDAGVARTTVAGYLEILEDTLLATRLPAYEARLRVRERKHPKLYWVDPGLVRAVKKQLGPVADEERGPLLEGWIFTLLRTYAEERSLYEEICYWAPLQSKHTEVDFLLRRGSDLLALEVKSARRVGSPQLKGLRAIGESEKVVRRILVYLGDQVLRTEEGIDIWPLDRFLAALAEDSLWP